MALTNCGECGNNVSDQAASCPHCGAPIPATSPVSSEDINNLRKDVRNLHRSHAYVAGEEVGEGTVTGLLWLAGNKYVALFCFWLASVIAVFTIGGQIGFTEDELSKSGYGGFALAALCIPLVVTFLLRKPIQKFLPLVLTAIVSTGLIALLVLFFGGVIYIAYNMLSG